MQRSCQKKKNTGKGFTLLELLIVIGIIGILGSALIVSVQSGYKSARQTNCKSNLRQFGVALTIYRAEHDNSTPDWLSSLYPDYVDDRAMYVCTADKNFGREEPRPEDLTSRDKIGKNEIDNDNKFWDNEKNNSRPDSSRAIEACSYLYEFSAATAPPKWVNNSGFPKSVMETTKTMGDYKNAQMRYGDGNNIINGEKMPYSASRIPIVRCYHHFKDMKLLCRTYTGEIERNYITLNVAYAGNVFVGPLWWEGTIYPGDSR